MSADFITEPTIVRIAVARYDNIAHNGYSDDALGIFMHISRIHIESGSKLNISSQADLFKFCEDERLLNDPIKLYPGEEFNVTFIAFDQLGSPVQTTVFNDHNEYTGI